MSKWQRALIWIGMFGAYIVGGCASNFSDEKDISKPPYMVPANATRVAEGAPPLSYMPTGPCTVYILDNSSQTLMNTSEGQGNDEHMFIFIDPVEKSVLVKSATNPSNRIVLASPIDPSHRFSIWVVQPSLLSPAAPPVPTTKP
jgi:hypothetical protein